MTDYSGRRIHHDDIVKAALRHFRCLLGVRSESQAALGSRLLRTALRPARHIDLCELFHHRGGIGKCKSGVESIQGQRPVRCEFVIWPLSTSGKQVAAYCPLRVITSNEISQTTWIFSDIMNETR